MSVPRITSFYFMDTCCVIIVELGVVRVKAYREKK